MQLKLISSSCCSVSARRSGAGIYSPQEKDPEDILLAQNPRLNGPRIAARARQGAATVWPLANNFLVRSCYKFVSHVDLLESSFVERISLDSGLDLGFILALKLITLIIAN